MVSFAVTFIFMASQFTSDFSEGAIAITLVGLFFSIPTYLAVGAVRLTLWALGALQPSSSRTPRNTP